MGGGRTKQHIQQDFESDRGEREVGIRLAFADHERNTGPQKAQAKAEWWMGKTFTHDRVHLLYTKR